MSTAFADRHLPPRALWPDLLFTRPELQYPAHLNCITRLLDDRVSGGWANRPCLITDTETLSYGALQDLVDRIAHVLVGELWLQPGDRVLLRGANTPVMAACFLAVLKAGGVAVNTMPLLRTRELAFQIQRAEIGLALYDPTLLDELRRVDAVRIVDFDELAHRARTAPAGFTAHDTAADDLCLIAFTSGTTGEAKATMHFHRDILAICDAYARNVLRPGEHDRFIGSAPFAFTFGLGGALLFPLHAGASTVLLDRATPDALLAAIARHRATICFTAPTAYRAMLAKLVPDDVRSLRRCVSAGEALPLATHEAWRAATGLALLDGIGATEMLHIFIGTAPDDIRPGSTGRVVPGYEARIIDAEGNEVADGTVGRLAVRGPTGCRYLSDPRQSAYVQSGWNVTGDTYLRDVDGYFWYQARSDDMIVSSGYNIAGPEVEGALLLHDAVAECAVVGVPDADRGMIVKAFVVLHPGRAEDAKALQDFVKAMIAPYKYPRAVAFVDALPRTATGKLQRFRLREP